MKHRRSVPLLVMVLVCSLLLIPTNSSAQGKTDFSGEWALNESKSNLGEGRFFSALKIAVKQGAESITIERTRQGRDGQEMVRSVTLTMDGKENLDESEFGSSTSTANWSEDGSSLIIGTKREFERQGQVSEMKSKEIWTLTEDGKALTIELTSSSPRGDRAATSVYDKK